MKNVVFRFSLFFILLLSVTDLVAQSYQNPEAADWVTYVIIFGVASIALFFVIQVADNFLGIEAEDVGVNTEKTNVSIFPSWNELVGSSKPKYIGDKKLKVLRKGHDILLEGEATGAIQTGKVRSFAVQPKNFVGMSPIPKVVVEAGQKVKAGDELFFDKKRPEIKYTAPVSGEVAAVNRGEKRSIAEVVILADEEIEYRSFDAPNLETASREELVNFLLESGAWTMIRQRPFNLPADPATTPRDVFISTFDTAPLAPNLSKVVEGKGAAFQKGLDVLAKLTDGSVYLGLDGRGKEEPSTVFTNAEGVEKNFFKGKHPAGNVGIQIHHTKGINQGDSVWTLGVQEVLTIGTLFLEGKFDASRVVVVVGAELEEPQYISTYLGANIGELLKNNLKNEHSRFVSGDVLSGQQKTTQEFLNFYDDQLTVIAEGDQYELFGWLFPIKARPSISNTFPNFLFPDQKFRAETNTHGEKRAFVVSSDYEQVMPADIMVQPLMKAIMANDLERMEGLGILELAQEDVALCEFVCTSKMPLQQILKDGLDAIREQG